MQGTRHPPTPVRLPVARALILVAAIAALLLVSFRIAAAETAPELYSEEGIGNSRLFSLASPIGTIAYTPGRGLHVGDTGLTLGGYSNVNLVRDEGGPASLTLDDLSFFIIWDPTPRLHFFSEQEFEDLLSVNDHGHGGTNKQTYSVERLYGDFAGSDQLNVRFGQFLTPVGRWNVIHAQPLVWTTSRPLVTIVPFAPQTTGAMLFGSFFPEAGSLTYSIYGQFVNALDAEPDAPQAADRDAGARLEYWSDGDSSIGASYLSFTDKGHWQNLGGLDTFCRRGPLELMGEFAYVGAPRTVGNQWGLYLQSALQVMPRVYLVGRYEHFDQRAPQPEVNLVIAGVAFKPVPYVVLKAEYLFADHPAEESPPGFKSSFAVLF
jgi:hypothetical protein